MHRFCERCERETLDGHLWCQDPECPAEMGYALLGYGDVVGDLKVTKLIRVWRTAAMYAAERDDQPVLLKLAHPGDAYADRLRREASVLQSLSPRRSRLRSLFNSFLPQSRSLIPIPLQPYPHRSKRPYGEITFRGEPRVFAVYEHASGKVLADVLLETPQLWHTHAAWLVSTVAEAIRPFAAKNKCHLYLTPDVILVEQDKQGIFRPMLMDMGFVIDVAENNTTYNWLKVCEPAYTAPEILAHSMNGSSHTLAADVYSLGMILYEMLAGHPGYEYKLRRDTQLRDDIVQVRKPLSVGRPELEQSGVASIVEHAVAPSGRYDNVIEFSKALRQVYSTPPAERKKIPRRLYVLLGLSALILLALGIVSAIILIQVLASGP